MKFRKNPPKKCGLFGCDEDIIEVKLIEDKFATVFTCNPDKQPCPGSGGGDVVSDD